MCVSKTKRAQGEERELELDIALEAIHIILGLWLVLLWFVLTVAYPRKNFSFFTKKNKIFYDFP